MTALAQARIKKVLRVGDRAVDATVGNGLDTFFLAHSVGPSGQVIGFDIQDLAHARTNIVLGEAGLLSRVRLIHSGHEKMLEELPRDWPGKVRAIMFNLGYLPRGDKQIITRPDTTLPALDAAAVCLQSGGVLTVVLYQGHRGGKTETQAVKDWAKKLPAQDYAMEHILPGQYVDDAPELLVVTKQ